MAKRKKGRTARATGKVSSAPSRRPGPGVRRFDLIAVGGLILLTLVAYCNSFENSFQFDDEPRILNEEGVRSFRGVCKLSPFFAGKRSVVYLTLWLNYRFGGYSAGGYHVFNVLVHAANGVLAYFFVLTLLSIRAGEGSAGASQGGSLRVRFIGLATGLLFALHPIQTQSVTYIIQRAELLAGFFGLITLLCYVSARRSASLGRGLVFYLAAGVSYMLALESKEQAAVLPLVVVMLEALVMGGHGRKGFREAVKRAAVPLGVMLLITVVFLGKLWSSYRVDTAAGFNIQGISMGQYALTNLRVLFVYLRLLALPVSQNLDYDFARSVSLIDPPTTLIALLFLAGIVAGAVLLARVRPLYSFCVSYFLIMLLPSSGLVPIVDVIFEHRLYMPCLGFFLLICCVVDELYVRLERINAGAAKIVLCAVSGAVIIGCVAGTFLRNRVWRTPETLWTDVVRKSPMKPRGHANLGQVYLLRAGKLKKGKNDAAVERREMLEKALYEYKKAAVLDVKRPDAHTNLGRVYIKLGKSDEAVEEFKLAAKYDPRNPMRYNDLAAACLNAKMARELDQYFDELFRNRRGFVVKVKERRKDAALRRTFSRINLQLGLALEVNEDGNRYASGFPADKAIAAYRRSIEMDPRPEAYYSIAVVFDRTGRGAEALKNYKRLLELYPNFFRADIAKKRIDELGP